MNLKCECYIHSLKQGEKNVLGEATILKRLGDNDYLAEYNGVKCHAMFNPFVGRYFCGRCVRHCPQFAGARRKINEKYDSAGAGIPARPLSCWKGGMCFE